MDDTNIELRSPLFGETVGSLYLVRYLVSKDNDLN